MCLLSNNRGVQKSNFTGEEQHPVLFLVAAELDHFAAKTAPDNVENFMEGVGDVHDGQ